MSEPTPHPLSVVDPWDAVADGYVSENLPHFEKYAADAIALAGLPHHARVLDVACGPGTLTFLVAHQAAHVAAIDFSPAMIAHLHRRLEDHLVGNVDARVGDGQALPYADGEFDAAFSLFGLMFFPRRDRGLAELRRVLRPGGRAVVSSWAPLEESPVIAALIASMGEALGQAREPSSGPGPLADPDAFRAELTAAGFASADIRRVSHAVEAPSLEVFWASVQKSFAPLALMRKRMGDAVFAGVADKIHAGLRARLGDGALRMEMPAWLGVGAAA